MLNNRVKILISNILHSISLQKNRPFATKYAIADGGGEVAWHQGRTALGDYRFLAHFISLAVWWVGRGLQKKGVPKVGHLYV